MTYLILGIALVGGCGGSQNAGGGTETDPAPGGSSGMPSDAGSEGSTGSATSGTDTAIPETEGAETSSSGETGDPPESGAARIGIFSVQTNYFELDTEDGPLKFHYGVSNSRWGAVRYPIAGDFHATGHDVIGLFDIRSRTFQLADANDSDEHAPRGMEVEITELPDPPLAQGGGEVPAELPIAGDWGGHGHAGVGVYHPGSNTFYLKDHVMTGPADRTVTLDPADGYPAGGWPVAGDFNGDGNIDLGISDRSTVSLHFGVEAGPPDIVFDAPGLAVAGDFDDDGVDTIATFSSGTNTFTIFDENAEGSEVTSVDFGYAEPGQWAWLPLAGAWQVPDEPVASEGFEWDEGNPADNGVNAEALAGALTDGENVADVYSILVARNGELIGERYYHGYDRHIAGNIKSVSKSVLSGLYGIAFEDGTFGAVSDTVGQYLPSYFGNLSAAKQAITLGDILTMRGGLEWSEGPAYVGNGMIPAADGVEYIVGLPLVQTPGTTYNYSTGLTHVGSAALTEASGMSTLEYARENLFEPIGISTPRWDGSPEGYLTGGAEMWMRPRDMARYGLVFLRDGEGILTSEWVNTSANPWIPESSGRFYGNWWRERPWSNYPAEDSFFAWGHGGQFIFLFPSWDLIVVVTSKWAVDQSQSGSASNAIFSFVNNQILTTIQ